jgi:hypothetical protein
VGYISSVRAKTMESAQILDEYLFDRKNGKYKASVEKYRTIINNMVPIGSGNVNIP